MNQIPINVPVFIQDFKEEENGRYTTAKLKVFYKGETADHRLFTEDFANEVIKTLPSTPVVAFYSEDGEDFIGHNSVQYAYGHVPETTKIEFKEDEDDGKTWAITDVILYTGRKDNIGNIAKKIVGKQHSLELDPDTLQYKINRDNQGRFLNFEFISGQFIGLSVLGDNEAPAFSGSGFFTTNEDFQTFAENCHAKFDKFLSFLNNSGGKIQVFNSAEYFSKAEQFLAKTMQEFQEDIYAALEKMDIYGWICENTTDYAVIYHYNQESDKCGYYKYEISNENGEMSLNNPVPVKARFLTDEQEQLLDSNSGNCASTEPKSKEDDASVSAEDDDDKKDKKEENAASTEDDENKKGKCAEDAGVADTNVTTATATEPNTNCASATKEDENKKGESDDTTDPQSDDQEKEKDKDKVGTATAGFSATTLSDSERAELAEYRKAAKLAAINEYKGELDEEVLDKYRAEVDNFSKEEIEAKLALEYRNFMKNNKEENVPVKGITTYSTISTAKSYDEYNPVDVVNKYNKK